MNTASDLTVKHFWAKVEKTDGCWLWTGSRDRLGYGRLASRLAHRLSYELLVGHIPDGLVLDHLCRNPSCVNPSHLEPVNQRENVLRGVGFTAVHALKTHCVNGHEFTADNTWLRTRRGTTTRVCRSCNRTRERERRQPVVRSLACHFCAQTFNARRSDTKYCSPLCKGRAKRAKRRMEIAA